MPFINVILKNGTAVPVPDADRADWVSERRHTAATADELRLICRRGETVLARFDADQVAGYVWRDGGLPLDSHR